ncbi:MAG: hypothetical protein HWD59_09425 [Coxiellaceae bacterium]|nr:MAG: hypothetical protein HWD59_09425 [Coxiellaceae bacterium]
MNSIQANGKVLFTHIQALFGAIWIDSQANYFVVLSVLLNILSVSDVTHVNRLIGVPDGLILPSKLNQLQINFGHTFNNNNLILNALIRPSALEEEIIDAKTSFQTLEFLGDKVFGCIIAEWLMSKLESVDSDILTPLFNKFVSNSQLLPMIAKNINLCESLIMGVGEEKVGVRLNSHRLADHMEALVAALWLDVSQDYQKTKERIVNLFHFELEKLLIRSYDMTPSVLTDTASFPPLPNNVSMHNKPSKNSHLKVSKAIKKRL